MRIQICRPDGADIYMPSDGYKYVDPTGLQTWRPRVLSEPLFISYCFVNFISESLQTFIDIVSYLIPNFAVFDFKAIEKIDESKLHSKCGWTPFKGFEAIFPREVYIRGIEVLKTEEKVGKVL